MCACSWNDSTWLTAVNMLSVHVHYRSHMSHRCVNIQLLWELHSLWSFPPNLEALTIAWAIHTADNHVTTIFGDAASWIRNSSHSPNLLWLQNEEITWHIVPITDLLLQVLSGQFVLVTVNCLHCKPRRKREHALLFVWEQYYMSLCTVVYTLQLRAHNLLTPTS